MNEGRVPVEPVVLTMDGSTSSSTAALLVPAGDGWQVVARRSDEDGRGQARQLLRLADDMLDQIGRAPGDVASIVVGTGPGTFTGVRIAVATARALALALNVPVVGASTLSAVAAGAIATMVRTGRPLPQAIIPVVDARRGQLFFGVYRLAPRQSAEAAPVRLSGTASRIARYIRREPYGVCDRPGLFEQVAASLPDEGGGSSEWSVLIAGAAELLEGGETGRGAGVLLLPLEARAEYLVAGQGRLQEPGEGPDGSRLGPWVRAVLADRAAGGERVFRPGEPGSPEAVAPVYVRSPDADIHITKMRDPWAASAGEE